MFLEERWVRGAWFLSTDLTTPFFVDLWVPIEDPVKFQIELRKLLQPSLGEESYYADRGPLSYRLMEWSQNAIVTKMSLIAEYNIFLGAWERHCAKLQYSQLYELWKWGEHVADVLGMDDLELLFPGGWRFELADLLDQFAK